MFGITMNAVSTPLKLPETFEWHSSNLLKRKPSAKFFTDFRKRNIQFDFRNVVSKIDEPKRIFYQKVTDKRTPFVQVDRRSLGRLDDVREFHKICVINGRMLWMQKRTKRFLALICLLKKFQKT